MPELPEVQTTVNGLNKKVLNHRIVDVWSQYNSSYFKGSGTIKDPAYFKSFKKNVVGTTIVKAERRAKNILIHLNNNKTILIHLKMTGHLLYGRYERNRNRKPSPWKPVHPESLKDPFNRHIRFLIDFDNNFQLALCDTRKFAKVTLLDSPSMHNSDHMKDIGPEPLEENFDFKKFISSINCMPDKKIKLVLLDQSVIAGIGNIYADESLWRANINPQELVSNIDSSRFRLLFKAIKTTLAKGIEFGGDSMSDYRNIDGEKGSFQEQHQAYRRTNKKCNKKGCNGYIKRIVVGGRGTHYCDSHQKIKST